MARSLTVQHEETPRTSLLFVTFVALSAGLLMLTWFTSAPVEGPVEAVPAAVGQLP